MIATLAFEPTMRVVRPHDALLPAACAAAEALRRSVAALLGRDVPARLTEPVSWEQHEHRALVAGARVLRAHGSNADAFVALRSLDARRLLAAAFAAAHDERPCPDIGIRGAPARANPRGGRSGLRAAMRCDRRCRARFTGSGGALRGGVL